MKASMYASPQTLTLPSGKKVLVKRPSLTSLLAAGGFPTGLTSHALKILSEKTLDRPAPTDATDKPEDVSKWAEMLDAFIPYVLVQPKVSDTSSVTEDENGLLGGSIAVADILDFDKQVIFYFGTGLYRSDEEMAEAKTKEATVEALKPFPEGSKRADAGHGGETIRTEAVVAGGSGG